jgi:hypothetical protein
MQYNTYKIASFTNNTMIKVEHEVVGEYFHPWQYGPGIFFHEKWLKGEILRRSIIYPDALAMGVVLHFQFSDCSLTVSLYDVHSTCHIELNN